jgi:hypothetical protein
MEERQIVRVICGMSWINQLAEAPDPEPRARQPVLKRAMRAVVEVRYDGLNHSGMAI